MLAVVAALDRLEHGRAQRRGQNQRHQHREHHRRDDRDRELAVDHARGAAEERHRQEDRRQHHGNANQRAGDFLHRFFGCLARRQFLFPHHAFDVLHHHDGVIHQESDSQHHAKQRQGVD
ncbi:hypothetical protein D3C81_1693800 [compost metagenome]